MPEKTPLLPTVRTDPTYSGTQEEAIYEEKKGRRICKALGVVFVTLLVTFFVLWLITVILKFA